MIAFLPGALVKISRLLPCILAAATLQAADPTPAPRTSESAVTHGRENLQWHDLFMKRIQDGPVGLLFLGDSITDFWSRRGELSWVKFAPWQPANFGLCAESTEQILWRITNGELDGINPKIVVIMAGTNNIGQFADEKPEWAAAGVKKTVAVVREKLPGSKVLLLGIFLRNGKNSPERARVQAVNRILSTFGDGNKIRYLDIGDKFLDANEEIPDEFMPDRLHPSAKGYNISYEDMNPTLQQMLR